MEPAKTSFAQEALWRLEAGFYDLFCGVMRLLPIDAASWIGGKLFRLVGPLTGAHKTARDNLKLAFPKLAEPELNRLLGEQWENNGRLAAEFPLMDRITPDSGRVDVVGRERFLEIAAQKRPVVFVSGHLSNFEVMASAIMDGGVTCLVTYRATNNPYVDQRIRDGRRAYGVRLFAPKGESARELIEALKAGETIAIMNDQKFNSGLLVDFFGHPAHTAPGPTRLALGSKAELRPLSVQRTRGARFRVIVHDAIPLTATGDRAADIAAGVESITAFVEERVRERPGEWFWVHRRWPNEVYAKLHEREAPVERRRRSRARRAWLLAGLTALSIGAGIGAYFWLDDIRRTALDPKVPFQVLQPPPAPDYASRSAWAARPDEAGRPLAVDVFFIHPTTYDGGGAWNGAIENERARRQTADVMLPNHGGPFVAAGGRLFAPYYRQASLYSMLRTNRDDARDARHLAYHDVQRAFRAFLSLTGGRPFILAGMEQGGTIAERLLREELAEPALRNRLVAAYLSETPVPAEAYEAGAAVPVCGRREQSGCLMAWTSSQRQLDLTELELQRALVWRSNGTLGPLGAREPLCVNPTLGTASTDKAPEDMSLGAANATGLPLGQRPQLILDKVAAHCERGVLRVSVKGDQSLVRAGGWADRLKAPPYNLFYGDLAVDARGRIAAWMRSHPPAP